MGSRLRLVIGQFWQIPDGPAYLVGCKVTINNVGGKIVGKKRNLLAVAHLLLEQST